MNVDFGGTSPQQLDDMENYGTETEDTEFEDVNDFDSSNDFDEMDISEESLEDMSDIDTGDDFDYAQDKKKKKIMSIVLGATLVLVILCLGLTAFLLTNQTSNENSIKKWVVEYLSNKLGEGLTDEEIMNLADQLAPMLPASDVNGLGNLDSSELEMITETVRQSLITSMTPEEAKMWSESIIKEYLEETSGIEGLSQYNIADILNRLDELQSNDSQIAQKIKEQESKINSSTGSKGEKGEKGEKGDKGLQGERGLTGSQGQQGSQGMQGIQGAKGEKGEKGEQGLAGKNGIDGKDGKNGIDGKDGKDGQEVFV